MTRSEIDSYLAQLLGSLNDDEALVLTRIAERLAKGRRGYGALGLDGDRRNFAIEMHEELLDAAVYGAMLVEQTRRRSH
jgi:hypothetical protein